MSLPDDLINIIIEYASETEYVIREGLEISNNHLIYLSSNPNAFDYFIKNPDQIKWNQFCMLSHDRAVDYILNFFESCKQNKINNILTTFYLSFNTNPRIIQYIINNPSHICLVFLAQNPSNKAVEYLLKLPREKLNNLSTLYINKNKKIVKYICNTLYKTLPHLINWSYLSGNTNSRAVKLLLLPENHSKISWFEFCMNTNSLAVDFLLSKNENGELIHYDNFRPSIALNPNDKIVSFLLEDEETRYSFKHSFNKNPNDRVIKFLFENEEYIDWHGLCCNTNRNLIDLLLVKHKDKIIEHKPFYSHPSIFIEIKKSN